MPTKAQELLARIAQQKEEIIAIQQLWASVFPEFGELSVRQCQVWLKLYTFDQVVEGIETSNIKCARPQGKVDEMMPWDIERLTSYASGVMKGLKMGRTFDHTGDMSKETTK